MTVDDAIRFAWAQGYGLGTAQLYVERRSKQRIDKFDIKRAFIKLADESFER